jgi:hypothetical protein
MGLENVHLVHLVQIVYRITKHLRFGKAGEAKDYPANMPVWIVKMTTIVRTIIGKNKLG